MGMVTIDTKAGRRRYEAIVLEFHALIRNGDLEHGARLPSERALAEQFKVSRSSVREAIRSLELQGLVVTKRGSGTFINTEDLDSVVALLASTLSSGPGSPDTLDDIFEVRHVLEPQISAMAALRASSEEIEGMAQILEEQERQIADGQTGVDADTAFHFSLATATHNAALVKVVSAVEDILRRSRNQALQTPGRPLRSLASHRRILESIKNGDAEGARRSMDHHLAVVEPAEISSIQSSAINAQPEG